MGITTYVIAVLTGVLGLCLGLLVGQRRAALQRGELRSELASLSAAAAADSSERVYAMADASFRATRTVVEPVQESLQALTARLESLHRHEEAWQASLREQVQTVRLSGEELRIQTQALTDALRRPQVRGHWGEMQLRRSLELAGLTRHCTFEEQVTTAGAGGAGGARPDVVVSMSGGRTVVIDSKVPLDAFLSAGSARSTDEQATHLHRHAAQVRHHMESLAAKTYWRQFDSAPEFVVMFLPAEAIFAQALDLDPALLDDSARRGVMIATPTTLIAMLKTISHVWTQDDVADNAREIHQAATELYDRLVTAGRHLDKVGRALGTAVGSYNSFVGSLETRVLVSARRQHDLHVGSEPVPSGTTLGEGPRPLSAPELVAEPDERVVVTGSPGQEQWVRPAVGE
jgi:DNA recombination protein RmuC